MKVDSAQLTSVRKAGLTLYLVTTGTQREYSSKPLKHSIVKLLVVF